MFGRQFKCDCGRLYNYKDLEKLYYVTDEQKEAAKERLSYYKDNHCLICLKSLIKEENIKKIKIRKEKERRGDSIGKITFGITREEIKSFVFGINFFLKIII